MYLQSIKGLAVPISDTVLISLLVEVPGVDACLAIACFSSSSCCFFSSRFFLKASFSPISSNSSCFFSISVFSFGCSSFFLFNNLSNKLSFFSEVFARSSLCFFTASSHKLWVSCPTSCCSLFWSCWPFPEPRWFCCCSWFWSCWPFPEPLWFCCCSWFWSCWLFPEPLWFCCCSCIILLYNCSAS